MPRISPARIGNGRSRAAVLMSCLCAFTLPLLTACGPGEVNQSTHSGTASTNTQIDNQSVSDAVLNLNDGWAKSAASGEMSGLFGTLRNITPEPVTIVSISSPMAERVELHEVVDGTMRQIERVITLAANADFALEPGANHIMLMGLNTPLLAGDSVEFTVNYLAGNVSGTFTTSVLIKDFTAANEEYSEQPKGSHDMGHG